MARLPVALFAYGQPPRPPAEASTVVTPCWSAARVLESAWPYVSWKCTPMRAGGHARLVQRGRAAPSHGPGWPRRSCRRGSARRSRGPAAPSRPGRPARRARRPPTGRRSTSTDSRAHARLAALARATTGSNMASDSSTVRLRLGAANVSVALSRTRRSGGRRARAPGPGRARSARGRAGPRPRAAGRRAAGTAARRRPVGAPTWGGRSWSPRWSSARPPRGGGRTPPSPRSGRPPSRSAGRRGRRPRGCGPGPAARGAGTVMGSPRHVGHSTPPRAGPPRPGPGPWRRSRRR